MIARIFTRAALAVSLSFAVLGGSPAMAQTAGNGDKVVAKVGDRTITQADLDQAMADMAQQFQSIPAAQRPARALDSLIDITVLAMQAEKDGLQDDPQLKRRLELLRNRTLHNGYFQNKVQPTITDEALKARFDSEIAKVEPQQEVKARHILVKTEEEANAIIKELEGGADFEQLAKDKSTGPSGPKGGDLGYFGRGRMVPEFEAAAFDLEVGAFTKSPVKSQFGFHIIKLDDKRDQPLPTFDQSKEQLRQVMLTEAYAKTVEEARKAVGVEVVEDSLKLPGN